MALSPRFLDDVKARVGLSDLIGRKVKLTKTGREHMGLCPFHNEKTPSFTVNDQKGFYHCFGCGAHGSAIDFVMNTEGLGFREAVTQLAGMAGLEVPQEDSRAVERSKAQKSLGDVMEDVTSWYESQLQSRGGGEALCYLTEKRGLTTETLAHFRLGYAPKSRSALKDAMLARGHSEEALVDTGMLIKPEDGGVSYDRFRNRVMFPIADRQGRLIAFGGRALDPDAKAKYLNSPETVLFHKGANLYNWQGARKASYERGQLLVVEGYMDVIALHQAGIPCAVAPLGTAISEEQIGHLWTMAEEPILSFDGDKAGQRAAARAMERALPILRPGKSLRFLLMGADTKDDPDTYVRREGREAFEALMDQATPLVDFLWATLLEDIDVSTPERRAGFEKKLYQTVGEITDDGIQRLFKMELRSRLNGFVRKNKVLAAPRTLPKGEEAKRYHWLYELGYNAGQTGQEPRTGSPYIVAGVTLKQGYDISWVERRSWPYRKGYQDGRKGIWSPEVKSPNGTASSAIGFAEGGAVVTTAMERLLVMTTINHPAILIKYEESLAVLPMHDALADDMRGALLFAATGDLPLEQDTLQDHLRQTGHGDLLDRLLDDGRVQLEWFAKPEAALSDALTAYEHIRARLLFFTELRYAYEEAEADFARDINEETQARFYAAQAAYRQAEEKVANIDNWGLESNRLPGP